MVQLEDVASAAREREVWLSRLGMGTETRYLIGLGAKL